MDMKTQETPSGVWQQDTDGSWSLTRDFTPKVIPGRRPEDYEPVLVDWFGPEAQGSPWQQIAGTGTTGWVYDPTAPTVAGVMRFGVATGQTAVLEWKGTTPLPFGLDDTYRCRIRVKSPDLFDGQVSVGMIGYAFDGTTVIDELGTNDPLLAHLAIRKITGLDEASINGYSLFEGYISGRAVSNVDLNVPADATSSPWDNALKLSNLVYYWRPVIKVTGGTFTANVDVDAVEVFRLDSNVVVPGTLQTDDFTSTTADIGTAIIDVLTLPPTVDDIAAGGPSTWVWTSDDSGTGHWAQTKPPIVYAPSEPVLPPGFGWWDSSKVDAEPFHVNVYPTTATLITCANASSTLTDCAGYDTFAFDVPCDGVILMDWSVFLRLLTASTLLVFTVSVKTATGCSVAAVDGNLWNAARFSTPTVMASDVLCRGSNVFLVTGVDETVGATIEFKYQFYNSGAANQYRIAQVLAEFRPRYNSRVLTLTTATP